MALTGRKSIESKYVNLTARRILQHFGGSSGSSWYLQEV